MATSQNTFHQEQYRLKCIVNFLFSCYLNIQSKATPFRWKKLCETAGIVIMMIKPSPCWRGSACKFRPAGECGTPGRTRGPVASSSDWWWTPAPLHSGPSPSSIWTGEREKERGYGLAYRQQRESVCGDNQTITAIFCDLECWSSITSEFPSRD